MDMNSEKLKAFLNGLYYVYARRGLVNPDPLYFLYDYDETADREIIALIASSLAYGRVAQIMKSVKFVLDKLTKYPHEFLLTCNNFKIIPENFKHRFTTAQDLNNLLKNISRVLLQNGSIENFLSTCISKSNNNFLDGLNIFADKLTQNHTNTFNLITAPKNGSACKRLFLYLKWLVRHDEVDPGGWKILKPQNLIIPLDTHMYKISKALGLTQRKTADLKTALEITDGFKKICPEDPTKYDFVLTRFGIREGMSEKDLTALLE